MTEPKHSSDDQLRDWPTLCDLAECSPDFLVVYKMSDREAVAWLQQRLSDRGHEVSEADILTARRTWPPKTEPLTMDDLTPRETMTHRIRIRGIPYLVQGGRTVIDDDQTPPPPHIAYLFDGGALWSPKTEPERCKLPAEEDKPRMVVNPEPLKVKPIPTCRQCHKRAPWCSCGAADYDNPHGSQADEDER